MIKIFCVFVALAIVLASCVPPRGAGATGDPESSWTSQLSPETSPAKQKCQELSKEKIAHALFFEPDYCFIDNQNGNYFLYRIK